MQNLAVTAVCMQRVAHEFGHAFQSLLSRLLAMEHWERDRMEEWRMQRLAAILLAARWTRFYESAIPEESRVTSDPAGVLKTLPLIDKTVVSRNSEAFLNNKIPKSLLVSRGTSGTTGSPLIVYWNRESMDWERALIWRQRLSAGCIFGQSWRGMLGGYRIVPVERRMPPFWRECSLAKLTYMSTFHLSPANASAYHKYISSRGIEYLTGYPSALFALAQLLKDAGLSLKLRGAFFGAEPLHAQHRSVIEPTLGCYVFDFYGLTERVVSASEFECRNGLHVNGENSYFEIVDKSGVGVEPGQYGELVGTSLSNSAFPLLRYRTGDMTRLLDPGCSCGRNSPRIAAIDSKIEDLLVLPDGSMMSASNLTFPFKGAHHIRQSQIYQPTTSLVIVRVVPDSGYCEEDGEKLLKGLAELFPKAVKIAVEKVDAIPRTRSGKYAFCISDVTKSTSTAGAGAQPSQPAHDPRG